MQIVTLLITVNDRLQAPQSVYKMPKNNERGTFPRNYLTLNIKIGKQYNVDLVPSKESLQLLDRRKISLLETFEMKFGHFGNPLYYMKHVISKLV